MWVYAVNNVISSGIDVRTGGAAKIASNSFENIRKPLTSRDSSEIGHRDLQASGSTSRQVAERCLLQVRAGHAFVASPLLRHSFAGPASRGAAGAATRYRVAIPFVQTRPCRFRPIPLLRPLRPPRLHCATR